jgi:L-threonylcarbamoyladenylate synthase
MPKIISIDSKKPDKKVIEAVVKSIRKGYTVIYPTDTVYGLGCNALDPKAVSKIFKIKRRPRNQALPIAVTNKRLAERFAFIDDQAKRLISVFWPGALTIIVKKRKIIPDETTAFHNTVGLRAPNHIVPQMIIKKLDLPLITTSANIHGKANPTSVKDVLSQIGREVDIILDGGKTISQSTSTVIDLTTSPPKILRKGEISKEKINEVIGFVAT